MSDLPTAAQLAELPVVLSVVAPPEYEDYNGHVNVVHHYGLHMTAVEAALTDLGLTPEVIGRGSSVFSVEHHLSYLTEIAVGDTIEGRVRFLDRGPRAVHGISVLSDVTTGAIGSLCEWVDVSVDLAQRRSVPFPDEIADALDARIARDGSLDWSLPAAGPMGTRGRR